MGIFNLSPDSFYDGTKSSALNYYNDKFLKIKEADIVDIGAQSTRPGSTDISDSLQLERLKVLNDFNLENKFLSIDSYKPNVIKYCLDMKFNMINDISGGGVNFENIDIAKEYNVPICLMHMQGKPENMQISPKYNNLLDDIYDYLALRIDYCHKIGFSLDNIIIDPGIGFGKSFEDNYRIISNLYKFKKLGCKILIGLSRKSFLQIDNDKPSDRLISSLTMQIISILNGADIIRTHDVNETMKSIATINKYKEINGITGLYK